jgi:hypothetical protein
MPRSPADQLAAACETRNVGLVRALFHHFAPPLPAPPQPASRASQKKKQKTTAGRTTAAAKAAAKAASKAAAKEAVAAAAAAARQRELLANAVAARAIHLADAPLLHLCGAELGADVDAMLGHCVWGHEDRFRQLVLAGMLPVDYEFGDWGNMMDWALYDGEVSYTPRPLLYAVLDFYLFVCNDEYICWWDIPFSVSLDTVSGVLRAHAC